MLHLVPPTSLPYHRAHLRATNYSRTIWPAKYPQTTAVQNGPSGRQGQEPYNMVYQADADNSRTKWSTSSSNNKHINMAHLVDTADIRIKWLAWQAQTKCVQYGAHMRTTRPIWQTDKTSDPERRDFVFSALAQAAGQGGGGGWAHTMLITKQACATGLQCHTLLAGSRARAQGDKSFLTGKTLWAPHGVRNTVTTNQNPMTAHARVGNTATSRQNPMAAQAKVPNTDTRTPNPMAAQAG
jgi:hypothetical protein